MNAETAYRIYRDSPDLVGYVESGKDARIALENLLKKERRCQHEGGKTVKPGEYWVRKLATRNADCRCFTVNDQFEIVDE